MRWNSPEGAAVTFGILVDQVDQRIADAGHGVAALHRVGVIAAIDGHRRGIRRGGGSVHRHNTGGVARSMVDNSHRRVCIRLGIDSGIGDHDGYRHRRGHDHRTVIALRTDIRVDAGGVARVPRESARSPLSGETIISGAGMPLK